MTVGDILISYLGRGREPKHEEHASGRSGYITSTYVMPDNQSDTSSVFGWLLWKYLVRVAKDSARRDAPLPTLLILGTSGSMWAGLADAVPGEAWTDELLEWQETLKKKCNAANITQGDLDASQKLLIPLLGIPDLRLRLIPDGNSREDQLEVLRCFLRELANGDRITFDITHAYRHLPILGAFTAMLLQWLRGVRIEHIYYGQFGSPTGSVVDVTLCADLARGAEALANLELTGNTEPLGSFFPRQKKDIAKVAYFERVNQMRKAESKAGPLCSALHQLAMKGNALQAALAPPLLRALKYSDRGSLPEHMLAQARRRFEHSDYSGALMLGTEAVLLYVALAMKLIHKANRFGDDVRKKARKDLLNCLNKDQKATFKRFNLLRNAVVHGAAISYDTMVLNALGDGDNDQLRKMINEGLTLAENIMNKSIPLSRPTVRRE